LSNAQPSLGQSAGIEVANSRKTLRTDAKSASGADCVRNRAFGAISDALIEVSLGRRAVELELLGTVAYTRNNGMNLLVPARDRRPD